MTDLQTVGFSIPSETVDRLDEIKRDWDARESRNISRSDVARRVLPPGLELFDQFIAEHDDEAFRMTDREMRTITRQSLLDFFRRPNTDDALRHLGEALDEDVSELRAALSDAGYDI